MLCDENFVAIAEAAVLKDLDSVKKARAVFDGVRRRRYFLMGGKKHGKNIEKP